MTAIQRDDAGGVRVEAVCPYCDGKRSKWNDSRKWNDICVPCAGMGSVHVTLPASTVAAIEAEAVAAYKARIQREAEARQARMVELDIESALLPGVDAGKNGGTDG